MTTWCKRSWQHRYKRKTYRSPEWFAERAQQQEAARQVAQAAEQLRWASLTPEQQQKELDAKVRAKVITDLLHSVYESFGRQMFSDLYGDGT